MNYEAVVVGGGLAGCEAAWQLARRNIKVKMYEMKPLKMSPAHHMDSLGELVCSNSLGADRLENASGLLKEEMRRLGSIIIECADKCKIPAGGALAVDRELFSGMVTDIIKNNSYIEVINQEVEQIPQDVNVIIATGPLTSQKLCDDVMRFTGQEHLYFYDAAAPIITYESIDKDIVFRGSRYQKGGDDYINCPMTEQQYNNFWSELVSGQTAQMKTFEKQVVFERCMPVEVMAGRGIQTLLFGPLKPVGLIDPKTGKQPYAVVQLRQDNKEGSLYNIVGFQTRLKWGEQKRIFSLIPGLSDVEIVRYGVIHRNTYINSPTILQPTYQCKTNEKIFFAGQISGVEGYVESSASGLVAGINMARKILGQDMLIFPPQTAIGALSAYISDGACKNFQPMNINYGLLPSPKIKIRNKQEKYRYISNKALEALSNLNCMVK